MAESKWKQRDGREQDGDLWGNYDTDLKQKKNTKGFSIAAVTRRVQKNPKNKR